MKALLVEDSPGMRKIISIMLKGMGYDQVIEAKHGGEALDYLRSTEVDLLLTDWNMPVLSGLDLIRKVREENSYDDLPVLMCTSRAEKQDVIDALSSGADSYITKPFTLPQLQAKVRSIIGKRQQQQIAQILQGCTQPTRDNDRLLVLFGEAFIKGEQLVQAERKEIARYLTRAVSTLKSIDAKSPDLKIGYLIENSTSAITKHLKFSGKWIKLLLLSPQLPGDGITLARLLNINKSSDFAVFIICETLAEIPTQARYVLDRMGISVLERHRLDREGLKQLFHEFILSRSPAEKNAELTSPTEIRDRLEQDIKNMFSLPVLPQVYHQIVTLNRNPRSEIRDWISAIDVDPLSRAQVLRRARSPIYGFQEEINDTSKAVILLGKNTVKEIIVMEAVKRSFEDLDQGDFSVEEYWRHSVAVALLARILSFPLVEAKWTSEQRRAFKEFNLPPKALETLKDLNLHERLSLTPEQDPFIGGMMHDIGKAALSHGYPGLFSQLLEELHTQAWKVPMNFAEEVVAGGANHMVVGRILGQSWQFEEDLCRLLEEHHNPASDDNFSCLIALADFLANGILPFPQQAAYPMVDLLRDDYAAATDREDALEAVQKFIPANLLQQLKLEITDLIATGRMLTPTVRQLVENIQESI